MHSIIQQTDKTLKIQQYLYMGEWFVTSSIDYELITSGLGSCIALCLYDSALKIGGMAHIVLPSRSIKNNNSPLNNVPTARYADEAVNILVHDLKKRYQNANLCAKLAGGSQMFQGIDKKHNDTNRFLPIGLNNAEAVKKELYQLKIPIYGADLGGCTGRTIIFNIANGKVYIKKVGLNEFIII